MSVKIHVMFKPLVWDFLVEISCCSVTAQLIALKFAKPLTNSTQEKMSPNIFEKYHMKLYGKVTKSSAVLQHSSPCCQWFTNYECLTCAKKVSWEPSDTEQQEAVGINLVYWFGLHLLAEWKATRPINTYIKYLWVWFHADLMQSNR